MKLHRHAVAGDSVTIYYPTRPSELDAFFDWLEGQTRLVAFDTETTGLDIYSPGFRLRLAQFGNGDEAWVIRADAFRHAIERAFDILLARGTPLVLHNATFDLLVIDAAGIAPLERTFRQVFDTRILAHLIDPRAKSEGGVGLGLKEQSSIYVDASAPDTQEGLQEVFRREYKATKETGWSVIDIDHPVYVLYAGLDVILAARLFDVLGAEVRRRGMAVLSNFEHSLASLLARLERRGFLLDVEYAERLGDDLLVVREEGLAEAALFGIDNVEAPKQVAAALEGAGAVLYERTKTGAPKTDKAVLASLVEHDAPYSPIAAAVLKAKRAQKFRESYVLAMLDLRDAADRVHPKINSLQARTARMSIARPPLQQLPSGDWTIRRCLVADPGKVIVAADYKQVEMRVLAALSQDKKMLEAVASGLDIHDVVAVILFGEGFTKAQRRLAKNTGFGKVFGGGAKTLARQSGTTVESAEAARRMFDRQFPGIKQFSGRLVERAKRNGYAVVTPSGRRLPLDRDRLYSATNYDVQSSARDVLAQALLDIEAAGLSDFLLLPVHDEVIAQADQGEADDVARSIQSVMEMDFHGVRLEADAEVYGRSWGHGYGAPPDAPLATAA